jgi:peptidoglycan/LPS O-acetylase OafA/YrhL
MTATGSATPPILAQPTQRLAALDGVRVVAMFMILMVHAEFSSRANTSGVVQAIAGRGDAAVAVFFLLSAFLLWRPMATRLLDGRSPAPAASFLARRLLRIYPAYWAILGVLVVIDAVELNSARDLLLAATLTFPFFDPPFTNSNFVGLGQTWAIALLLQSYAALPLLARLLRRFGHRDSREEYAQRLLRWCGAMTLFGLASRSVVSFGSPSWELHAVAWLPIWLDVVGPGLALATWSAATERGLLGDHPITRFMFGPMARRPVLGWLTAGAAYLFAAWLDAPERPDLIGAEYSFRNIAFAVVALAVVATAAHSAPETHLLTRVLGTTPMQWLSRLSLGFFIGHLAIMGKVESWLGYEPFRSEMLPLMAVTAPLALALAAAVYYAVELPVARRITTLFRSSPSGS